ncbi:Ribonuclease VapC [Candidatus Electrothrix aarhusensis]
MILLDTNIVSEVMRRIPSERVLSWLDNKNHTDLLVSSITIAEICYGLRILPVGQRRKQLEVGFEKLVARRFSGRIIDFAESAARVYAEIMGACKEKGRPMSIPDGQIAAGGRRDQHLALATRNICVFVNVKFEFINSFE